MAGLDDTWLRRRGVAALKTAQDGATSILDAGGVATPEGWRLFQQLERDLLILKSSPRGSADMLSATIFIDYISRNDEPKYKGNLTGPEPKRSNGRMRRTVLVL
jgi:triphosphoribosyl-dephospho-CoA synthase